MVVQKYIFELNLIYVHLIFICGEVILFPISGRSVSNLT
jgi:hypothetical protein